MVVEASQVPQLNNLPKLQRELADMITKQAPLDEIRILLASGAQVNEQVVQGLRPLHYAVYASNTQCVRLLLIRGADVDAVDDVGYSAVHLCAEHGNYTLLEYLINHGARVCFVDRNNHELFPRGFKSEEPLRLAIKNGHHDCAELLLQNGADPNARYFLGPEITLISSTNLKFLELLLLYGANPNVYDRDGFTPLMRACRHKGGLVSIQVLLKYGADVNANALARQDLRTPLHYAVLSGDIKMVSCLIHAGAHVNMPKDYTKPSPLDMAVLRDDPELVEMLLEAGSNPMAVYTYIGTALHLACSSELVSQYEIMKLLLDYGSDPNFCPEFDDGILKSAFVEYLRSNRSHYDINVVRLMLQYGGRVIMQTSLHNPKGMLRTLLRLGDVDEDLWHLFLEAGESYDLQAVERLNLTPRRRIQLLHQASQPASLLHCSRLAVRKSLHPMRPEDIQELPVSNHMRHYLLYEYLMNVYAP